MNLIVKSTLFYFNMLNLGKHVLESYAHFLNADETLLKVNPALEKFGYRFVWVGASEFERNFSEILNVPKDDSRPLTIMIGRESTGISNELHNAIIHTQVLGARFLHTESPPELSFYGKLRIFKFPVVAEIF